LYILRLAHLTKHQREYIYGSIHST